MKTLCHENTYKHFSLSRTGSACMCTCALEEKPKDIHCSIFQNRFEKEKGNSDKTLKQWDGKLFWTGAYREDRCLGFFVFLVPLFFPVPDIIMRKKKKNICTIPRIMSGEDVGKYNNRN